MGISRTVIISCAGMGNRLGLNTTKALVDIDGKPLIAYHLSLLQNERDVRVVVGYQAEKVIETVRRYRDDVIFVFNHQFRETGTGASVVLASRYAQEYILSLDGDLLIHPEDMQKILDCNHEFISGGDIETDDPWLVQTYEESGKEWVSAFSHCRGNYEWNGITQMKSAKIQKGQGHVFHLLEPYLPVKFMKVRTKEIDTINDYEKAISWVKNNYED